MELKKQQRRKVAPGCGGLLFLVLAVAVLVVLYFTSPWRDAEVSLGLRSLPGSARNLVVSVDAWTDYVVRGYMEVSPEDFEKVIGARRYDRR